LIAAAQIAEAFRAACREEIEAPKPGNVHIFAAGHNMTAADFLASAEAAAGPIAASGARVGARILDAVSASFAAVGMNTNLGIVLLCAPLAAAAERGGELNQALTAVLRNLDQTDADRVLALQRAMTSISVLRSASCRRWARRRPAIGSPINMRPISMMFL
jgi:triphosphoribosyl-dephospho-CoA synthase